MKRRMNFGDLSLVPLINVVFLLLMFFIVVGALRVPDLETVRVPDAQTGTTQSTKALTILLTRGEDLILNNQRVTEPMLETSLRTAFKIDPTQTIVIKAEARLRAALLTRIIGMITRAGGRNVIITTEAV